MFSLSFKRDFSSDSGVSIMNAEDPYTVNDSLASLACNPDGPGLEVSVLEDPGKDSLGFGRLTLGLKRAAHSNFEELAVLACSLSRVLRRGEGLEAERERRALV